MCQTACFFTVRTCLLELTAKSLLDTTQKSKFIIKRNSAKGTLPVLKNRGRSPGNYTAISFAPLVGKIMECLFKNVIEKTSASGNIIKNSRHHLNIPSRSYLTQLEYQMTNKDQRRECSSWNIFRFL